MCFYDDDCDWYATIVEDEVLTAGKPTKCDECGRIIQHGEWIRHIFIQEHEVCIHDPESEDRFEDYDDNDEPIPHPDDCKHDYGETFHYDRCEVCDQLIESIHQHELDEGCLASESRPALTELYEAMIYDDDGKHLAKAETLYPGITTRIWPDWLKAIHRFRDED